MPKLGLTMREGTLLQWRCQESHAVRRGDIVAIIESEKVEFEVEAPEDGIVRAILVPEGTTVPCGEVLAILTETADEPFEAEAFRAQSEAQAAVGSRRPEPGTLSDREPGRRSGRERRASPRARRLAEKQGVPLSLVVGTGPEGRITEADVKAAIDMLGPRVAIGNSRVAYTDVEGPEPPVVFLTGFGLDRTAFNRQLAELAGWRRLLAPDPRGTGGSTSLGEEDATVESLATDLEAFLDALEIGCTDLVGSSLGAAVATEVARRSSPRVRRLVLISPPALPDARLGSAIEGFCRSAESEDPRLRLQVMAPWLFGPTFLGDTAAVERTLRGVAGAAETIPARTLREQRGALAAWCECALERYETVSAPTLVIVGADDLLTPPAHAEAAAQRMPRARLERLDNVGHAPMVEAPDRLHALLREFLDAEG
jgi:pimeloyl-ACP methyl ester carboxylesterase